MNTVHAHLAVLLAVAAACGDDGGGQPDAVDHGDGDGRPDAQWIGCDHDETSDATNSETPEPSDLTADADGITICGVLAANTPGAGGLTDVDGYTFTVAAGGRFLVRVDAPVGTTLDAVTSTTVSSSNMLRGRGVYVGDHLVYAAALAADTFVVDVVGAHGAQPEAPVPYRITILPDAPATRCPDVAGAASYVEAADGSLNVDNDMALVTWATGMAQTPSTADAPEPSAQRLVITAGMSYKASGELATPNGGATDDYLDRDTYLIASGAETNEISIRVAWPGTDADVDFLLFVVPDGVTAPVPLASGTLATNTPPEFETLAVLPSTTYWLWVGNYDGSAEPKTYDATICGHDYEP